MSGASPIPLGHGGDALAGDAALAAERNFHTLDALRGLAAAVIVLFHAGFIFSLAKPPMGFLAVDLFFAMSGFIIAHRYDADLAAGMGLRRFATLRLVRLYPLFLLGTLLGALPSVLTLLLQGPMLQGPMPQGAAREHLHLLSALPPALVMLPSHAGLPALRTIYPLNFVGWSLAFEMVANLCYAALFPRLGLRALAAVAAAGFVGLCLCAARWHTLEVGFEWPHVVGGFARIAFAFPLGVLLRRLTLGQRAGASGGAPLRLPRVPWPVPLAATLALLCVPPPPGSGALWSLVGCTVLMPLILAAAVSVEPPRRLHRACALLGVYSYVLYSLHEPLVGLWLRAMTRLHGDIVHPGLGGAASFVALLATVCVIAHHAYDKPLRRRLTRRLVHRSRRDAVQPRSGILSLPS